MHLLRGCGVPIQQVAFLYPTGTAIRSANTLPDLTSSADCRSPGRLHGRVVRPGMERLAIGSGAQVDAKVVSVADAPRLSLILRLVCDRTECRTGCRWFGRWSRCW